MSLAVEGRIDAVSDRGSASVTGHGHRLRIDLPREAKPSLGLRDLRRLSRIYQTWEPLLRRTGLHCEFCRDGFLIAEAGASVSGNFLGRFIGPRLAIHARALLP